MKRSASACAAFCLLLSPAVFADEPLADSSGPPVTAGDGFRIETFAGPDRVQNGTALAVADDGSVYVCETWRWTQGVEDNRAHTRWIMDDLAVRNLTQRRKMLRKWQDHFPPGYFTAQADRLMRLTDDNGDGIADRAAEFAGGFRDEVDGPAIGVLPALNDPHTVYFTCSPKLWKLAGDGGGTSRDVLADGFGIRTSLSGHDLHGLAWGPDGMLYFSMGDRGFHVTTADGRTLSAPDTGGVFRCRPDGSGMEQVAFGLRNPQELAFNEFGDLFTVDNNCDQGDLARICWLLEGSESGWHIGHQALTTYKPFLETGGIEQPPHWLTENLWKVRHDGQPLWIVPPLAHLTAGPSGLSFTSGLSLPDRYRGSFFICDYRGAPSLCFLYNFKVEREGAGYAVRDAHLFHKGVPNSDVDFGPDGKLYLLDYGGGWARSDAGHVYTISWQPGIESDANRGTERLLRDGANGAGDAELAERLGHPDLRVRMRAQYALASREPAPVDLLAGILRDTTRSDVARRHALWTLGQLSAVAPIREALTFPDPELRAQAARTLGTLRAASAAPAIRPLLADDSPRARMFAAIALGRMGDVDSADALTEMVERQGTDDPFLRLAGVMGFKGCLTSAALEALHSHPSPAVRLTAVLALRRLCDAGCGEFLNDPDPAIAAEALRAVADIPIPGALPSITDLARRIRDRQAPAHLTTDVHFRRIVRGLQAEGSNYSAAALADLAAAGHLTIDQRRLALRTLRHFASPPPIDPTTGLWRPLPPREPGPIREAVESRLAPLLETPGELTADVLALHESPGIAIDSETVAGWAADAAQPADLRLAAIPLTDAGVLRPLLDDPLPDIRIAASQKIAAAEPAAAVRLAGALIDRGSPPEIRAACALLATSADPEAARLLAGSLERLRAGNFPESAAIDLLDACSARTEPALTESVAALESALAAGGRSLLDFTLTGGDPERGSEVFANQGTCLKCHRIEGAGGNAGPKLAGLAVRQKPGEILHSLTNPNAAIVPGYGMTVLVLNDGTAVAGTPIDADAGGAPADDDLLVLRTAEGAVLRLGKSDIRDQSPPVSPMPAIAATLPRRDLRDLMAYLLTLNQPPVELK